ncbi:MAG: lipase family protein [Nostoc sp. CmiSLP01]|nr:lipase family protein [Nostoc sp. CmiSLP01]MDZ8286324.1 lipase family protein [Nostoc sp. ChiSLP01]
MKSYILTPEELELSLILAQASSFTYYQKFLFDDITRKTGIENIEIFNFNGGKNSCISGFIGCYKYYIIIVFKGTDCLDDWKANLCVWKIGVEDDNGRVHHGFSQAVTNNWDKILELIQKYLSQDKTQNKKILLTGHSLGGALAILTASKLSYLPEFSNRIEAVYTYGAPRVGDKVFEEKYKPNHYRFEYSNDPVPSSPSLSYKHTGDQYFLPKNEPTIHLNSQGLQAYQVHIKLASALVNVFVKNINLNLINDSIKHLQGVFDDVSDHNIEKYIQHLENYKHFLFVIKGLQDGTLKRHGSLIKDANTGNIVCFLLEQPQQGTNQLPISPAPNGASLVINSIEKIPLQMSSITTGASVLNLGISLAGFVYISSKLDKMQTDIKNLQQSIDDGFARIEHSLDLLNLRVEDINQNILIIGEAVSNIRQDILDNNISQLMSAIDSKNAYPTTSGVYFVGQVSQVIHSLSTRARREVPKLEIKTILFTSCAMQSWAMATELLAYFYLENQMIEQAKELLNTQVKNFKDTSKKWAKALIYHDISNIATVYRFTVPTFNEKITREQVDRIAYISSEDTSLSIDDKCVEAETAFFMVEYREKLRNPEWITTQIVVADYLDTLSELLARLESLQAFIDLSNSQGINSIGEILPANNDEPGFYLQFHPEWNIEAF